MRRRKLVAAFFVAFLSGCVAGALGMGLFVRHRLNSLVEGGPPAARTLAVNRLSSLLGLSPEQKREIEPIVAAAQQKVMLLRKEIEPGVEQAINDAARDIRTRLNAEQQKKLDTVQKRLIKVWKSKSAGPPAAAPLP